MTKSPRALLVLALASMLACEDRQQRLAENIEADVREVSPDCVLHRPMGDIVLVCNSIDPARPEGLQAIVTRRCRELQRAKVRQVRLQTKGRTWVTGDVAAGNCAFSSGP